MTGAATRGLLMALLVVSPALLMPDVADKSQFTVLFALLAGVLTFAEYNSTAPSIIEFRDAPPFNRIRFASLAAMLLFVSVIMRDQSEVSTLSNAVASLSTIIGNLLDFPYSPVRLVVLMLPDNSDMSLVAAIRSSAGIAYLISLMTMVAFFFLVRVKGWPTHRGGPFNVLINLPLFDPTAGGDVIERLQRDARVNIALGFLLPFLIPAVVKATADLLDPVTLQNPQTIIWTVSAWAFLPASMIMRGIAMSRVADLIEDKRRRTYANAEAEGDGSFQAA